MKHFLSVSLPVALALAGLTVVPAQARDEQGEARKEMKAGNALSLREIEKRVLPKMKGSEYLGPAYDAAARAYRLKFIRDGRVTYVDVDARTGRIIKQSQ
ncbi:PepSY domain-containing protein [Altererythrobacter sp.]|uniref:PepSY domain-containing protein n=1 Tax=Altererythrobacter sp. TaxID=1872480 RepID=UPI003D0291FD